MKKVIIYFSFLFYRVLAETLNINNPQRSQIHIV